MGWCSGWRSVHWWCRQVMELGVELHTAAGQQQLGAPIGDSTLRWMLAHHYVKCARVTDASGVRFGRYSAAMDTLLPESAFVEVAYIYLLQHPLVAVRASCILHRHRQTADPCRRLGCPVGPRAPITHRSVTFETRDTKDTAYTGPRPPKHLYT
jgi:hypothetical protein